MKTYNISKINKLNDGSANISIIIDSELRDEIEALPTYNEGTLNEETGITTHEESLTISVKGLGEQVFTYDVEYKDDEFHSQPEEGDVITAYVTAQAMLSMNYTQKRKTIGTQSEVAELLGISRDAIAKREGGQVEVKKEMLLALESIKLKENAIYSRIKNEILTLALNAEFSMDLTSDMF